MNDELSIYDNIKIPDELSSVVDSAIHRSAKKMRDTSLMPYSIVSFGLIVCLMFALSVNLSPGIAQAVSNVPLLNTLAKIVTIVSYETFDPSSHIKVTIPVLVDSQNEELEKSVNESISSKINELVSTSKQFAHDFYTLSLEANPEQTEFFPFIIDIDYDIYAQTDEFVSFSISKTETYATSSTEKFYYNIDLKTGTSLTLPQLLGTNFKEIINPIVTAEIANREQADEEQMFFKGEDGFTSVRDDQPFYLTPEKEVVIIFNEYEIAPGYMGIIEFKIK